MHGVEKGPVSSKPFATLCPLEDHTPPALEEGEVLPSVEVESEVIHGSQENCPVYPQSPCAEPLFQEILKSPSRPSSSPSYAEILKKKSVDYSSSSEEEQS